MLKAEMHKIILIMLLTTASSTVSAEWVKITGDADGMLTVYADPSTISKSESLVKMWSLHDFKTAQIDDGGDPYNSSKIQSEYDCKKERRQVLELSNFSGNMGTGEVVFSYYDSGRWSLFEHESISEYLWKYACGM